ncbi:hypothetical protein ACFW04_003707 [Cataglyphis niger]
MASSNTVRIKLLNKENYDTWKTQMQALLIKNEAWAVNKWIIEDEKARADIILLIKPSQLKQIKECRTLRELWLKLYSIYQLSGPARKATLIKQLTYHHMQEGEDMRKHIQRFFDTVDRLNEMEVEINSDLLSVMLLQSLFPSFGNFRCAIESRDTLSSPKTQKHETREGITNAMVAKRQFSKKPGARNKSDQEWRNDSKT